MASWFSYHDLPPHPSLSHSIQVSRRVIATDQPVIMKTKQLMARAPAGEQVLSLAQGIVHWQPPPAALEVASRLLQDGDAGDIWLQDIIERVYIYYYNALALSVSLHQACHVCQQATQCNHTSCLYCMQPPPLLVCAASVDHTCQ